MANNRLYIVDLDTGEWVFLAKSLAQGWYTTGDDLSAELDAFFSKINPETKKPLDWPCAAGLPECQTRLVLMDETTFDPTGFAAEKRRLVDIVQRQLKKT
jgi:hypothetical protein